MKYNFKGVKFSQRNSEVLFMGTNKERILWITRTALFTALVIVVQAATKSMTQLVTGSAVNTMLALASLVCGVSVGGTVAFLSPIFKIPQSIKILFPTTVGTENSYKTVLPIVLLVTSNSSILSE